MNILMVGELYKFGGASEIMEILAGRLEAYGHHVILLYGFNPGGVKNIEEIDANAHQYAQAKLDGLIAEYKQAHGLADD